jgi:hypothetical protein
MPSSSPPAGKPAAEVEMSGRRWSLWLGPPIALVAVVLLLGQLQPRAEAGGRMTAPPAGACAGPAPLGRAIQGARGTWWRLEDRLDGNGTLTGRMLFAGNGKTTTLGLALGAESMARGPVGGLIVVASDDGRFSEVRLVSAVEGCSWLVHRTESVVRSALLDASNGTILAHLLQRETRADLGTWRVTGVDPDSTLQVVLGPLAPRVDLGPIWVTELRLDAKGRTLAVQSCAEPACVTRIVALDRPQAAPISIEGPDQGSIVGLANGRLFTWEHCPGMPCAIQAWEVGAGKHAALVQRAVGAALTPEGRYLVVVLDASGHAQRIDLATKVGQRIRGIGPGELPLGTGIGSDAGTEVGSNELALAAPGSDARAFDPAGAAVEP